MRRLLSVLAGVVCALLVVGSTTAADFTWDTVARRTLALYDELA